MVIFQKNKNNLKTIHTLLSFFFHAFTLNFFNIFSNFHRSKTNQQGSFENFNVSTKLDHIPTSTLRPQTLINPNSLFLGP